MVWSLRMPDRYGRTRPSRSVAPVAAILVRTLAWPTRSSDSAGELGEGCPSGSSPTQLSTGMRLAQVELSIARLPEPPGTGKLVTSCCSHIRLRRVKLLKASLS